MSERIWLDTPADRWENGFPVGNGKLGAMVLGRVPTERIALNHERLWRGRYRHRDTTPADQERLAEVRRLFFDGQVKAAGEKAIDLLSGKGDPETGKRGRVDPYQPAGDLCIDIDGAGLRSYRRELDLATATTTVQHAAEQSMVTRQVVAHAALPIIAVHLQVNGAPVDMTVRLNRIPDPATTMRFATSLAQRETQMTMAGVFDGEDVAFEVLASVFADTEATVEPAGNGQAVHVAGARELVVLLTIAADTEGGNPSAEAKRQLDGARSVLGDDPADGWTRLHRSHVEAWRKYYGRVAFELAGADDNADTPTDRRLAALRRGQADEGPLVTYFHLGRYLLIASAINGDLPPNLQGIWNERLAPPWDCDIHNDVNIQMNYWPAEPCGLPEAVGPLFALIEHFAPHAAKAARDLYGCEGVLYPIQTDPWGRATPESRCWDVWVGAASWLAQHFWWRWEWGQDEAFLRHRAYPFFKQCAAFWQTYLVEHPHHPQWLVPVPSQSPENYFVGGTRPVSLCVGATMDIQLCRDVLSHAIAAAERLDVDEDERRRWAEIIDRLPPLQIGRHGQLQEWLEDYEEEEPGHRHISHLFGLFPSDQITGEATPQLAQAARVSLDRRLAHKGGHTGWSRAWTVCCWARLGEGDAARKHVRNLVSEHATDSLLDLHPTGDQQSVFQIDGNFGGTAGICEMLMQSHHQLIRILPALPGAWPAGRVIGLHARGGFVVDIAWADGRATEIVIRSLRGGLCRIALPNRPPVEIASRAGRTEANDKNGVLAFETEAGARYVISPRS